MENNKEPSYRVVKVRVGQLCDFIDRVFVPAELAPFSKVVVKLYVPGTVFFSPVDIDEERIQQIDDEKFATFFRLLVPTEKRRPITRANVDQYNTRDSKIEALVTQYVTLPTITLNDANQLRMFLFDTLRDLGVTADVYRDIDGYVGRVFGYRSITDLRQYTQRKMLASRPLLTHNQWENSLGRIKIPNLYYEPK